jgi:hypothetical protein
MPQVFTANVVVPPYSRVEIVITYITPLKLDQGRLRFVLPTRIAPRYTSSSEPSSSSASSSVAVPDSAGAAYGLSLTLRTELSTPGIPSVTSPTHPLSVRVDGPSSAVVTMQSAYTYLDKDLVLLIEAGDLAAPRVVVEKHPEDGTHALMLSMVPNLELEEIKQSNRPLNSLHKEKKPSPL